MARAAGSRATSFPTVRQLAVDLAINPNTVVRAYRELELGGLLETQQGTGTFISAAKDQARRSGTRAATGAACRAILWRAPAPPVSPWRICWNNCANRAPSTAEGDRIMIEQRCSCRSMVAADRVFVVCCRRGRWLTALTAHPAPLFVGAVHRHLSAVCDQGGAAMGESGAAAVGPLCRACAGRDGSTWFRSSIRSAAMSISGCA